MKVTSTGIAVALAVAVVAVVFIFPGLSPFGQLSGPPPAQTAAAVDAVPPTNQPLSTTTMPIDNDKLQIVDETVGTGATASAGDLVTVNYVGSLTNGTVFDASANHGKTGFTFPLGAGQVIKGWDQGIVGMKEGGKRMLLIPPALAYGSQAVGGVIPANSALVFEVELLKVVKGK